MKDLQVGDRVLTAGNTYQPIYSFGHYNPVRTAEFRQVHTKDSVIEMTAEHLVFLKDQAHPVRADSVRVGDELLGHEGNTQTITDIRTIQRRGLYTPFTPDGTIVVDGIVASSYVSLQAGNSFLEMKGGLQLPLSMHDYIHMGMSPMRMVCLGVYPHYCHSLNEEGIPPYVALSIDVTNWVNEQHGLVQALLLAAFLLVYVPLVVIEAIFGSSNALLAIFAFAAVNRVRQTLNSVVTRPKAL